jgi:Ca2+-binding RTX toxin-like protein
MLLIALALLGCGCASLLGSSALKPAPANAASCTISDVALSSDQTLTVSGGSCADLDETLDVYCNLGQVYVDHTVEAGLVDTNNSGVACATPRRISISGNEGDDELDLSRVAKVTGFRGITGQSTLNGGAGRDQLFGSPFSDSALGRGGADTVFLRDGGGDSADCGDGVDAAIADQPSLDPLANCENVDALPDPPTAPGGGPDNDFTIGKAEKNKKKGSAILPVEVPGPGALELAGKGLKPASADASGAGEVDLAIKAKGKAKKKLKQKGKKKFEPSVTFTPTGGTANTEDTTVKLVRK